MCSSCLIDDSIICDGSGHYNCNAMPSVQLLCVLLESLTTVFNIEIFECIVLIVEVASIMNEFIKIRPNKVKNMFLVLLPGQFFAK